MALFDDHLKMLQFVKIVQEFPEIYDQNTDSDRRWSAYKAWDKIAERVKTEMDIECTVQELKNKWKGIRSSFNRYKCKLIQSRNDKNQPKKYHLYDALRFLDPITKPKKIAENSDMNEVNVSFEECYDNAVEYTNDSEEYNDNHSEWSQIDVKPDITKRNKHESQSSESEEEKLACESKKAKKRRHFKNDIDDDNEDLQFFRSILPDIVHFTSKEKRRLKINILKLIDDIENERK